MTFPSRLASKLLAALVPILTSRRTREAFGFTLQRPLSNNYGPLLLEVNARITAAGWTPPSNFNDEDRVVTYWYSLENLIGSSLNYHELNSMLRTGTHKQSVDLWILFLYLYEAVEKLPRRKRISYRVCDAFTGFGSIYYPGTSVTEKAFLSSTKNPRPAFSGGLYFTIIGKSGRELTPVTRYVTEDEILFLPGVNFAVLTTEELSDGSIHIALQEN